MTTYRQILRFSPDSGPGRDINELHKLVMAGYRDHLTDGAEAQRAAANILFLAARPGTKPTRVQGRRTIARAGATGQVLVQAQIPGDWSQTSYASDDSLGLTATSPLEVNYDFQAGDMVELRGLISATRARAPQVDPQTGRPGRGRKYTITDPNELSQWLAARLGQAGFEVDPMELRVEDRQRMEGHRTGEATTGTVIVDCQQVQLRGVVTDPGSFREVLVEGLGRKRAYGVGLLRHRII